MKIAYLDTRFVPLDRAKVSILDRGFLYGDGVFETMRAYAGCVFRLEAHLERMSGALKTLGIRTAFNKPRIQKIVYDLLERNKLSSPEKKDAYVKIIVTRGRSSGLPAALPGARPTLAIYALPYTPPPENLYKNGIRALVSGPVHNEKSRIAGCKTLNYLPNILYRFEAKRKKFDDIILVNHEGFISEATASNIFLVKNKILFTPCPASGILSGITRGEVIRLAKKFLKCEIREGFIKIGTLYGANEIFLTNSLAEIMPVVRIGKNTIGTGKPGPVTRKLSGLYRDSARSCRPGCCASGDASAK